MTTYLDHVKQKCLKSLSKRDDVQTNVKRKQSRIFLTAGKWRYAFQHSQQKGAWNSTPTPWWNWKTLRATGFGLENWENDVSRFLRRRFTTSRGSRFEPATYLTRGDVNAGALRSSYTMRTKCTISDTFVRDCVFAYCASVAQHVYFLSAEHCFRLRNNAISDERFRDCAHSTHSVFRLLANWANRPSWPPRDKCLYDSQSIVSALAWKRLCKRRTKHHKIADIFQSGAKWQKKTNVFPI